MVALLVAAPAARAADPVDHSQPPAPDGTPICAAWVHDQYTVERGGPQLGHLAPSARPALRLRIRPRARLKPACVQVFRPHGHAGVRARERLRGQPGGARRVQGLRRERGPQGARVDDRPAPGIRLAAARQRALPFARDLAFPRARPPNVGANAPDGRTSARPWRTARGSRAASAWRLLPVPGCGRPTRSGPRRSTSAACSGRAPPSASTTRSPSSTRPIRSAWSSTSGGLRAADPAGWESRCKGDRRSVFHPRWFVRNDGPSRFRTDAYGRRADRGPASDRLAPHPRGPAPRARRRGERVHRRAALGRRDLPRRARLAPAEGLRVPRLLRAAQQLT